MLATNSPTPSLVPQARNSFQESKDYLRLFRQEIPFPFSQAEENELKFLSSSPSSEQFFEGLFQMGLRSLRKGEEEKSFSIWQWLDRQSQEEQFPTALKIEIKKELQAMLGGGTFGRRFEYLMPKVLKEAIGYQNILPMVAGTAVYGLARATVLCRLIQAGPAAWFARGFTARTIAAASAFSLEVATFTSISHALHAGKNERKTGIDKDLFGTALSLAFLKSAGSLSERLLGLLPNTQLALATRKFLPHASMFLGLWASRRTEQAMGLREKTNLTSEFLDTLASHFSLQIGGELGRQILGRRFALLNQGLDQRLTENGPALSTHTRELLKDVALAPMWMAMGTGPGGGGKSPRWETIQHFFFHGTKGLSPETPETYSRAFTEAGKRPGEAISPETGDFRVTYKPGHGYWMEATGQHGFRIVRLIGTANQVIPIAEGKDAFLRDGDILQIQKELPFLFRDNTVPIFRRGHRYPTNKVPEDLEQAIRLIAGTSMNFVLRKFRDGKSFPVAMGSHRTLGMYFQTNSGGYPITLHSLAKGKENTILHDPDAPLLIFPEQGDILQFGSEEPFIWQRPFNPKGMKANLQNIIRDYAPEAFIDLAILAITRPNTWIPGLGEFGHLKLRFNPLKFFFTIAYKTPGPNQNIYVTSELTQFSAENEIGFDIRDDRILQFGEEGQPWTIRRSQWEQKIQKKFDADRKKEAEQRARQQEEARKREQEQRTQQEEAQRRAEEEARRTRERAHRAGRSNAGGESRGRNDEPRKRTFRSDLSYAQASELLGGGPFISEPELKARYRRVALANHPDRFTDPQEKPAAEARFKKCMEAYLVICHEQGFEPTQN